jgi:hypothetical protein
MPDLLTPPRRNERIGPSLAPAISVRYLGSAIWVSREARLVAGAWLRNVGSEVARRIAIPDLAVAPDVWCQFRQIDDLEPGEEASLDPVFCLAADKGHLEYATLTGVISKAVVNRVLAGGSPFVRWVLRVEYEGSDGQKIVSACEIEVVSVPLTLRATPTRIETGGANTP